MSRVLLLFYLLLPLLLAAPRLRQLLEVCRHGARSPVSEVFPENWNLPAGQLTDQGSRMHYLIGNELRKEFIQDTKFLDQSFNIQQIYVRATPVNRTIMSARSQLLGLYPPGSGPSLTQNQIGLALPAIGQDEVQEFVQELGTDALQGKVDAIPVEVKQGTPDYILLGYDKDCPKAQKLEYEKEYSTEFIAGLQPLQIAGLSLAIERIFGLENFTLADPRAWGYADNMVATNFQYPELNPYNLTWHELAAARNYLNYMFYQGFYGDPFVVQISQTALFNDIVVRFRECINNDKNIAQLEQSCLKTGSPSDCLKAQTSERNRLKFTFYSAHDTNIAGMIAFMELNMYGFPPPYASTFFFKLYSKTDELTGIEGDYFVEVLLNGATVYTFRDFPQFANFVSSRAYKGNIAQACKLDGEGSKDSKNLFLSVGLPIIIGVIVIAAIMITIYCCCCRKKKDKFLESTRIDREGLVRKSSQEDMSSEIMTSKRDSTKINKSEI